MSTFAWSSFVRDKHWLALVAGRTSINQGFFVPWADGNQLEHPEKRLIDGLAFFPPFSETCAAPGWRGSQEAARGEIADPPRGGQQMKI
jgi:hypothetical protein